MSHCEICKTFGGLMVSCEKCKVFWVCEECCSSFLHAHRMDCKVLPTVKQALRLKIGDDVIFRRIGAVDCEWIEGVVVELWPETNDAQCCAPLYAIEVTLGSQRSIYYQNIDSNGHIHLKDFNLSVLKQKVLHHVKYGDPFEHIRKLVESTNSGESMDYWAPLIMHNAASFGNKAALCNAITKLNANPSMKDSKGRNVLHLSAMAKMEVFFVYLVCNIDKMRDCSLKEMLQAVDDDGRNLFHFVVMFNTPMIFDYLLDVSSSTELYVKDLMTAPDNMGRSAIDYAVMLKRSDFLNRMVTPTFSLQISACLGGLQDGDSLMLFRDDKVFLAYLQKCFGVKVIPLDGVKLKTLDVDVLTGIAMFAAQWGCLESLKWLLDGQWKLVDKLCKHDSSDFIETLIWKFLSEVFAASSELDAYFNSLLHKPYRHKLDQRLRSWFHDNCLQWNAGQRFGEYLDSIANKCLCPPDDDNPLVEDLPRAVESMLKSAYFKTQIDNQQEMTTKDTTVLTYLICKLPVHKRKSVLLYKCFANRQWSLLSWYASAFEVDLSAPLRSNEDIWKVAAGALQLSSCFSEADWEALTIVQYSCAMSIIFDSVPGFTRSVSAHGNSAKKVKQLRMGGLNLIQYAFSMGTYCIVKHCLFTGLFTWADLTASDFNPFRHAVATGHHHLAELCMNRLGNKACLGVSAGLIADYYNMNSSCLIRFDWTRSAITIQAFVRRFLVCRRQQHYLGVNHSKWRQFQRHWSALSNSLNEKPFFAADWHEVKRQFDMVVALSEDSVSELSRNVAGLSLFGNSGCPTTDASEVSNDTELVTRIDDQLSYQRCQEQSVVSVELTVNALKWLNTAECALRRQFLQRVAQLAAGERSYALSKRLQHCAYPVYETKLDKGMRILWTKLQRGMLGSILIWYVSKHDDVPRRLALMSASSKRLSRDLKVVGNEDASTETTLQLDDDDVIIDPTGNCPLKIYKASSADLTARSDVRDAVEWKPPLRLSGKQRQVNEESGTVMLLGRSGTGKTLCLCDRMSRDALMGLKQLFVCRSSRLCEFARAYQQQNANADSLVNMHFMTLASFTSQMNINIKMDHGASQSKFLSIDAVDFRRFAVVFAGIQRKCVLPATVVWLQIRSFIKGSVEAVIRHHPLTIEQYCDLSVFGADRCRLSMTDRKEVYALFLRYQDVLKSQGLWDDADYTLDLLTRSKLEPLSSQYDKVYVDEVQDNTQAEIMLYFLAAGMNTQSLFLAGDPAQSVVEGVDFRFEGVRSIVYKLSGGKFSINRPMKLFVNYRSHSGILSCAAAVLDKMFAMFPGSAKVLPRDAGLFKGPRPACCQVDGMEGQVKLLSKNERLVVLCADEEAECVESELTRMGIKNTVLGIRAAKGLEFQDVVLLDFFRQVPKTDYSVWKSLFTSDAVAATATHPHIELQLKLLYTAITRSCNRLLFVETEKTSLSSVMFRWLVGAGLAETYIAADESTVLMTSDEWRVQGIEFALSAEGENTVTFLEKAVKCFILAADSELLSRTLAQLELVTLRDRLFAHSNMLTCADDERLIVTASDTLLRGLRCGLVNQVFELCELIAPRVEYGVIFGFEVVDKLRKWVKV